MAKSIYSAEHAHLIKRLKQARKEAGLEQLEAGTLIGKTQSYISKIETGQLRIDVVQLKEFARIYKKKIDFFIK